MTRVSLTIAILGAGLALTSAAQAHPIRECGGYGYTKSGAGPYFLPDRLIYGAGVYNITTRGVRCHTAHRMVKRVQRCEEAVCYVGSFRCRTRQVGSELDDSRCRSSRSRHYVVHWQSGA